jgi:hypothetical protein
VDLSCLAGSQAQVQGREDFSFFETPKFRNLNPADTQGVSDLLGFCRDKRAEVQDVIFLIDVSRRWVIFDADHQPTASVEEFPFGHDAAETLEEKQTEQAM